MKKYLFLLIFFTISLSGFSKYRPAVVVLKNGDSITGIIGDIQRKAFKYKFQNNGEVKKINYSEIDFVQLVFDRTDIKTYKFFLLNNSEKYTSFEEVTAGKKAELYTLSYHMRSLGAAGPSIRFETLEFYVKKPTEENLTKLGMYDPIIGNLKEKVIHYFSDCPELKEKVLSKDFKVRKDMEAIVDFYNNECNSLLR